MLVASGVLHHLFQLCIKLLFFLLRIFAFLEIFPTVGSFHLGIFIAEADVEAGLVGVALAHLGNELVVGRLPHFEEVFFKADMLSVVFEPDFADCAIAVAGAGFWLEDISHWNLEYFRIDSQLMHGFLFPSVLLAEFIGETEARGGKKPVSSENWHR